MTGLCPRAGTRDAHARARSVGGGLEARRWGGKPEALSFWGRIPRGGRDLSSGSSLKRDDVRGGRISSPWFFFFFHLMHDLISVETTYCRRSTFDLDTRACLGVLRSRRCVCGMLLKLGAREKAGQRHTRGILPSSQVRLGRSRGTCTYSRRRGEEVVHPSTCVVRLGPRAITGGHS